MKFAKNTLRKWYTNTYGFFPNVPKANEEQFYKKVNEDYKRENEAAVKVIKEKTKTKNQERYKFTKKVKQFLEPKAAVRVEGYKQVANDVTKHVVKKLTQGIFERVKKRSTPKFAHLRYWIMDNSTNRYYAYDSGFESNVIGKELEVGKLYILNESMQKHKIISGEKWADVKEQVQSMSGVAFFKAVASDKEAWEEYLSKETGDIKSTLSYSASALLAAMLVGLTDTDTEVNEPFHKRRLRDSADEIYIANKFMTYCVDPEASSWDTFITEDTHENLETLSDLKQSCAAKALIRIYADSYKKVFGKPLTIESIVRVCKGRTYDGGEVELTVTELTKWFREHNVGLEIYNVDNRLIHEYTPAKFHRALRPRRTRLIYQNEHIEAIRLLKQFEQKTTYTLDADNDEIFNTVRIPKLNDHNYRYYALCNDVKEVLPAIQKGIKIMLPGIVLCETMYILFNGPLNDILKELFDAGYTPYISTRSGISITGITLPFIQIPYEGRFPSIDIEILSVSQGVGETEFKVDSVEQYIAIQQHRETFNTLLMNKNTLSEMDESVSEIFDKCTPSIALGKCGSIRQNFTAVSRDEVLEIDHSKFYASCLHNLPYLPVVSPFDTFTAFNSKVDRIKSDELYLVKVKERTDLYNQDRTLMFGWELLVVKERLSIEIIAYLPLITRPINPVREAIEALFSNKQIPMHFIKAIPNHAIGKCGQKYKRHRHTCAFKNEDDAIEYMKDMKGGARFPFCDGVWLVNSIKEVRLKDGFTPIRVATLGEARLQMFMLTERLQQDGFKVLGYHTDALYVQAPKQAIEKLSYIRKGLNKPFGGYKLTNEKLPPTLPIPQLKIEGNFKIYVIEKEQRTLDFYFSKHEDFDEYSRDQVRSRIKPYTVAMCKGGRGKTFAIIDYALNKYKKEEILVVCPWNSQAKTIVSTYRVNAVTVNKLQGEGISDDQHVTAEALDNYKCIILDEIMLPTHRQLCKIWDIMKDNPSIEFLATGDPCQLDAIGDVIDNERKKTYVLKMFPNVLQLHINKRIRPEHRARLYAIEKDIFSGNFTVEELVAKHFSSQTIKSLAQIKELNIKRAVSYLNSSSKTLNNHIHTYYPHSKHMAAQVKTLSNGTTYYYHGFLICKSNLHFMEDKVKKKCYPNYIYKIMGMNNKTFELEDVLFEENYKVSHETIMKHFSLPYCNTVHSSQGDKIAEKFVIADWQSGLVDMKWINTAITRTTNLDDVYFLDCNLTNLNAKTMATEMVRGYKHQDAKANRAIDESQFVTPDWILANYRKNKICRCCGGFMSFERGAACKVTVNRLDNSKAHIQDNCELLCLNCNKTLK